MARQGAKNQIQFQRSILNFIVDKFQAHQSCLSTMVPFASLKDLRPLWMAFYVLSILLLCTPGNAEGAEFRVIPLPRKDPCPTACEISGYLSNNWTVYGDINSIKNCPDTVLLDFAIHTSLDDPSKRNTIRACTENQSNSAATTKHAPSGYVASQSNTNASAQVLWWGSSGSSKKYDINSDISKVRGVLSENAGVSILFASNQNVTVGVFAGALVKESLLNANFMQTFMDYVDDRGIDQSLLTQVCGDDRQGDYSFGIVVATGDQKLSTVQKAVSSWSNGTCVTGGDGMSSLGGFNTPIKPTKSVTKSATPVIDARSSCKTTSVASGDSCYSLAQKCGISLTEFEDYNPGSSFCSDLQPGQIVCCTSGTLPTPTPNANGSCASYTVQSEDYCAQIAAKNGITIDDLESWNSDTWGWTGCDPLQAGIKMCISTGTPPMPAPVTNAVCGPQVPGTLQPASNANLSLLNPCPLNACCDIWGQCGTTTEFCTPSGTGPPGTAAPGQNGCISNCGTDIVKSAPPTSLKSVAYFEGWNPSRPCLQMDVSQIDNSSYTHVHFSFAGISNNTYEVNIGSDIQSQFKNFAKLTTSMKKVLSIGGWTFSTATFDYSIFRTGMTEQYRGVMATNVANCMCPQS
jgi:LysM repeat protein